MGKVEGKLARVELISGEGRWGISSTRPDSRATDEYKNNGTITKQSILHEHPEERNVKATTSGTINQ